MSISATVFDLFWKTRRGQILPPNEARVNVSLKSRDPYYKTTNNTWNGSIFKIGEWYRYSIPSKRAIPCHTFAFSTLFDITADDARVFLKHERFPSITDYLSWKRETENKRGSIVIAVHSRIEWYADWPPWPKLWPDRAGPDLDFRVSLQFDLCRDRRYVIDSLSMRSLQKKKILGCLDFCHATIFDEVIGQKTRPAIGGSTSEVTTSATYLANREGGSKG